MYYNICTLTSDTCSLVSCQPDSQHERKEITFPPYWMKRQHFCCLSLSTRFSEGISDGSLLVWFRTGTAFCSPGENWSSQNRVIKHHSLHLRLWFTSLCSETHWVSCQKLFGFLPSPSFCHGGHPRTWYPVCIGACSPFQTECSLGNFNVGEGNILKFSFSWAIFFFPLYYFSVYLIIVNMDNCFIPCFQGTLFCLCTHCLCTYFVPTV